MEGTRHEKAALIVAAYVIGFVTAFIAFGLTKINPETKVLLIEAKDALSSQKEEVHNFVTSVGFGADGLYSITQDTERILAADRNALAASVVLATAEPGFYYEIIDAEASRDGRFIYYCEQLTKEAENCDPYVYVLAEDTLYHVKKDDMAFYPIIQSHESMWTDDSMLMVNDAVSNDPNRPWELTTLSEVSVQ
jgi:hypothetical protein